MVVLLSLSITIKSLPGRSATISSGRMSVVVLLSLSFSIKSLLNKCHITLREDECGCSIISFLFN